MFNFFLKKLSILLISLLVTTTATFFLMHLIPGDPFQQEDFIPKEILESLHKHYGLDQPVYIQYFQYLKKLITFDFGPSFQYEGRSINQIIGEGFPVSLLLGLEALTLSFFLGLTIGSIAAFKRNKTIGKTASFVAVLGISFPSFILASGLQYIFALKLHLLPIARFDSLAHTILPSLALSALPTAHIARLTRASIIEVLGQDYIKTAIAKGLTPFRILFKHVLRNAIIPPVTYLGQVTSAIFTGSFVVEKIFGIPGLGQWFINSVLNRDYSAIMGITIFYSALVIVSMFITDLLYRLIDPRISWEKHHAN